MKLDNEQLEAVVRLLGNADFCKVLSAMADHAEGLNKKLVMGRLDAGELHNLQGQTKSMVILMETFTEAPSQLQKLSEPKV